MKKLIQRFRLPISIGLAFCTTFTLIFGGIVSLGSSAYSSGNILALLVFAAISLLFYKTLPLIKEPRLCILGVCTALIFAAFSTIGQMYGGILPKTHSTLRYACVFFGLWALFSGMCLVLFSALSRREGGRWPGDRLLGRLYAMPYKKQFVWLYGLLLLCYVPAFLANYPGLLSFDGPTQIYQLLHEHFLSAANPLLGNLLIGGSVWLGHAIFGSYNAGLALYSCLQAACVTAVFAYTLCFMIRHCVPRLAVLISALFFAFNPFFHVFVFTTIKENLFGAALLILFLFTVDLILSPDRFFKSKALQARYIGMALLMCLLRNQGIFLLVLMIPFVVWACRIKRIRLAGLCLSAVALYYALTGPLSAVLNVQHPQYIDAFGVPIQQVARVMNQSPESVTEEQKRILYEIIPPEGFEDYNPLTADDVKSQVVLEKLAEYPGRYLRVYFEIGLQNLRAYIDAFFTMCYPYISPGVYCYYQPEAYKNYLESINVFKIHRQSLFPAYQSFLETMIDEGKMYRLPVLSLCVDLAFPMWSLLFVGAYAVYKRRCRILAPMVLWVAFWLSLLLGPVALSRYAMPMIMALPAIWSLLFVKGEPLQSSAKEEKSILKQP